jgi:hypothetical protein
MLFAGAVLEARLLAGISFLMKQEGGAPTDYILKGEVSKTSTVNQETKKERKKIKKITHKLLAIRTNDI